MDMVFTSIPMMLVMKGNERMINSMGKERNPGQMVQCMKENTAKAKNTAKAFCVLEMVPNM